MPNPRYHDLDPKKQEKLETICAQLGLHPSTIDGVVFDACGLKVFEDRHKPRLQTPRQRAKALEKVAGLANDLFFAVHAIGGVDLHILNGRPVFSEIQDEHLFPIEIDLLSLREAARDACEALGDDGSKGGRMPTLEHYSKTVSELAERVKYDGITPGRGGKFEILCTAVFAAAGVHALPEGAIKHYLASLKTDKVSKIAPPDSME